MENQYNFTEIKINHNSKHTENTVFESLVKYYFLLRILSWGLLLN